MKNLILIVFAILTFGCQQKDLSPKEVAIKFMEAIVKQDIKSASQCIRAQAVSELEGEMAKMKRDSGNRKVSDVKAEIIEEYEENGQPCFKLMVYFKVDGEEQNQDGYTCLLQENGVWKVGQE